MNLLLMQKYAIGHVDPGETDELVTAFRETREESGLLQSDLKVYKETKKVLEYDVGGRPKKVIYWLAELINPSATVKLSDEHQSYKWLPIKEACQYGNYSDMKELLNYYHNFINSHIK